MSTTAPRQVLTRIAPGLQRRERVRADQVLRLRREVDVQAHVVRGAEQLAELHAPRAVLGCRVVHGLRVGEDDPSLEAAQQLGDALADAPEADEADGRLGQLDAEVLLGLPAGPFAAAEDLIGLDHPAPRRQHEGDGELGGGVREDVRGVRRAQRRARARRRRRCCRSRRRSSRRPSACRPRGRAAPRRRARSGRRRSRSRPARARAASRGRSGRPPVCTSKSRLEHVEARGGQRAGDDDLHGRELTSRCRCPRRRVCSPRDRTPHARRDARRARACSPPAAAATTSPPRSRA